MTQIKQTPIEKAGTFKAIANVNFSLPVNMYDGVKEYNERYLAEVREVSGEIVKMPPHMTHRNIARGDILLFADKPVVNTDTGQVEVYPMGVFKELNSYTVELPCEMRGEVVANFEKSLQSLPAHLRKDLEKNKSAVTARFRTVPYLEEYTGQQIND